jgi:triacylglycerol lipase
VWPTLFNPSTYLGMAKLGVITAKVVLGRSVERQPLSTTDAR